MGKAASPPRRIWLTLEAPEIIELKQAMMDRDARDARAFFQRVVVPRVRRAAERREMIAGVPSGQPEEATKADQG
jgi:hypothetical protein